MLFLPPELRQAVLDLLLLRHSQDIGIHVLRREGNVGITMVK